MNRVLFLIISLLTISIYAQDRPGRFDVIYMDTLTTTERNALSLRPSQASIIFNSTDDEVQLYNGTTWVSLSGTTYTAGDGIDITGSVISDDGNNVKLTGTQTITGTKYFNSQIRIGNYLSSNDHAVRIANDGVQISSLNRQNSWYIFNNLGYADDLKDEGRISIYPTDEFIEDHAFY